MFVDAFFRKCARLVSPPVREKLGARNKVARLTYQKSFVKKPAGARLAVARSPA